MVPGVFLRVKKGPRRPPVIRGARGKRQGKILEANRTLIREKTIQQSEHCIKNIAKERTNHTQGAPASS